MDAVAVKDIDLSVILVAFFSALAVIIPTFLATYFRQGRTDRKVDTIVEAATAITTTVGEKNGGSDLATSVHQLYQVVEVISAQIHTNTKEVTRVIENQSQLSDKLNHHDQA